MVLIKESGYPSNIARTQGQMKQYFEDILAFLTDINGQNSIFRTTAKNPLINANFDVWQRGTSFTATGLTADRWRMTLGTGAAVTVTRQPFTLGQVDVPGEPKYFIRLNRSTVGTTVTKLSQRIEGVRTFAGQDVTVGFWMNAPQAAIVVSVRARQHFGTGGTPSADVVTFLYSISSTVGWLKVPAGLAPNYNKPIPPITGKTLGTNNNDYLELEIEIEAAGSGGNWDFAQFQIENGNGQTNYDAKPFAEELRRCQRYYAKTFPLETVPAQNAGLTGALTTVGVSTGRFLFNWVLPARMRAAPTVTPYNPSAGNASARNTTDSTDAAVTSTIDEHVVAALSTSVTAGNANDVIRLHMAADAEL